MRLQNKTCIVTGAGAGIGFATARAFADEGATVIALDRDQAGLSTLARRQTSLNTQILDVTDVDAVVEFFKVQDKADVLFNCAGMVATGDLLTCTPSDFSQTMTLAFTGHKSRCSPAPQASTPYAYIIRSSRDMTRTRTAFSSNAGCLN